jgi:hypothetical protein
MIPRTYSLIAGIIFSLVALLHALRLRGWHVVIGDLSVPVWVSWLGLVIAGYLTYQGFQLSRRIRSDLKVFGK